MKTKQEIKDEILELYGATTALGEAMNVLHAQRMEKSKQMMALNHMLKEMGDDASAEQPEQGQWDAIPDAFNEWWNADYDDSTNPFRPDSSAYWAWAGWSAANKEKNG
jgi:peptidoglycan hydrolase CwlO-like protein